MLLLLIVLNLIDQRVVLLCGLEDRRWSMSASAKD